MGAPLEVTSIVVVVVVVVDHVGVMEREKHMSAFEHSCPSQ